ncbi:arylsulfatase [Flammeovirga sp. OC4]|uniref:arylsulfatase n=1 Tax=Flammeovirga sp. OC4 TaxID=1382345 RepID=UPI0005C48EC5|nr:arylsulfatase [Flammeovirga sp. OC4]
MKKYLFLVLLFALSEMTYADKKPNIIMIMTDDVAPQDLSIYHRGLGAVNTPNIDKIGNDGMMLTDYYAQQSCTAGRSSFLTGQYPIRTGLTSVGQPGSKLGLNAKDVTLGELLQDQGYATAHFGKSHLGDRNEHLPTVHGFDEFYGFLYHLNMMDMPEQPEFPDDPNFVGRPRNVIYSKATTTDDPTVDPRWGKVGKQVIEDRGELGKLRQETFDDEVLEYSQKWLKEKKKAEEDFFLFFNPSRMHQEIYVSEKWSGKSGHSTYADGLLHLDYLVGELLKTLDEIGEADNTIVMFTSDNGVNLAHWPSGGTASFRGEKGTTWDGGFRVPMLVKWPKNIPAGTWSGELFTAEDWVPTLMAMIGEDNVKEELLEGKEVNGTEFKVHIDGYNQMDVLTQNGKSKRREFFFYAENELQAIRVDQWKIYLAVKDEWLKDSEKLPGGMIVNLKLDPYERSIDTPGHFLWMKEKSWVLPTIAPPLKAFAESMKAFPPRQKGTGIGAAALLNQLNNK